MSKKFNMKKIQVLQGQTVTFAMFYEVNNTFVILDLKATPSVPLIRGTISSPLIRGTEGG